MRVFFTSVVIALVVVGCSGNNKDPQEIESPVEVERVTLTMAMGVNNNWPVAVELIRVRNPTQLAQLLRMETTQWFADQGNTFRQTYLSPAAYYDGWEIVPGTTVGADEVEAAEDDVAGVLFCHTRAKSPPIRFDLDGDVIVHIRDDGCTLSGGTVVESPEEKPSSSEEENIWSYLWPWGEE